MPKSNSMDALAYLLGKKWPSSRKVGLVLLLSTVICCFNQKASVLVPKLFPFVVSHGAFGFLWGAAVMMAGLVTIATCLSLVFAVPFYACYRVNNTLHSWIRQRVVEEMLCSGLTGRQILDPLVVYAVRWWAVAVVPSVLVGFMLLSHVFSDWTAPGIVIYLLAGAAVGYMGLASVTWTSLPGSTAKTPIFAVCFLLQILPVLFLMLVGVTNVTLLAAALYAIVMGRWAAIYGLEKWESLAQFDNRICRTFRRIWSRRGQTLPENPIAARESMRGLNSTTLLLRLLAGLGFVLSTAIAWTTGAVWLYALLVLSVVVAGSYLGASRMAQMMAEEVESRTLDTLRSTPITSNEFLGGWLQTVLFGQVRDNLCLLFGVVVALLAMGRVDALTNGLVVVSAGFVVLLPVVGAYLGASIASQDKTRAQISGQLLLAFLCVLFFATPQVLAMNSSQMGGLLVSLCTTLVATAGFCWLLKAGAKKSLNRVFLPQAVVGRDH